MQRFDLCHARVAKLADARDLKSRVLNRTYRFNSGPGHQDCEILRCAQDLGCGLPLRTAAAFTDVHEVLIIKIPAVPDRVKSYKLVGDYQ
jgi:hypothetical protein